MRQTKKQKRERVKGRRRKESDRYLSQRFLCASRHSSILFFSLSLFSLSLVAIYLLRVLFSHSLFLSALIQNIYLQFAVLLSTEGKLLLSLGAEASPYLRVHGCTARWRDRPLRLPGGTRRSKTRDCRGGSPREPLSSSALRKAVAVCSLSFLLCCPTSSATLRRRRRFLLSLDCPSRLPTLSALPSSLSSFLPLRLRQAAPRESRQTGRTVAQLLRKTGKEEKEREGEKRGETRNREGIGHKYQRL